MNPTSNIWSTSLGVFVQDFVRLELVLSLYSCVKCVRTPVLEVAYSRLLNTSTMYHYSNAADRKNLDASGKTFKDIGT